MKDRRNVHDGFTRDSHGSDRLDRSTDPLLDLVGHVERHQPGGDVFADPRFVEWMVRDGTLSTAGRGRLSEKERRSLAERIQGSILAERSGLKEMGELPVLESLDSGGTVTQMIDEAEQGHYAVVPGLSIAAGAGRELWDAECESLVRLPPGIPPGRYVALSVKGGSMLPLLHDADMVLVRLGERVKTGSVIVARDQHDGYVVKRVGRVTARSLELLSVNPEFAPLMIQRSARAVLGTVVLRWRADRS